MSTLAQHNHNHSHHDNHRHSNGHLFSHSSDHFSSHSEEFERHIREFEKRVEEMNREFLDHFPNHSWLKDRDLWLKPFPSFSLLRRDRKGLFASWSELEKELDEHRAEMRRHFDEVDRHFAEIARKHGVEMVGNNNELQLRPQVRDGLVSLELNLPKSVDPDKIRVSVKDGDLVVQADDKQQKGGERSELHYYRRSTLPPGADLDRIKCDLVNGNKLSITAPINPTHLSGRDIQVNKQY